MHFTCNVDLITLVTLNS